VRSMIVREEYGRQFSMRRTSVRTVVHELPVAADRRDAMEPRQRLGDLRS
jgi:hypothetical protein